MTIWPSKSLGDVADFYAGASLPQGVAFESQAGGFFLVKVSEMNLPGNERFIRTCREWSPIAGARSATCPAGSVLIPKRGGAIGTNKKRITTRPSVLDPNLMAIHPRPEVLDLGYLFQWLQNFDLTSISSGSSVPQLNKKDLEPLVVPIPPLHEQRRIAHVLAEADALRAKRRKTLDHLDDLAQSIFSSTFGNVVTNERLWDESKLLSDMADVASGITKGRTVGQATTRSVPYLAVANVQDMRLDLRLVKTIDATEVEIDRYKLQRNDLLLTEGGDPDKLGRGVLWQAEIPECIHQNHIFRVRLKKNSEISPLFLNWLVSSPRGRSYFLRCAKQTTGIASINTTQLRNFPVLVPPTGVQERFAKELSKIEQQRRSQRAHLAELNSLFEVLQYRAFRGEL
jgi:type I restriction enzyme S subunit